MGYRFREGEAVADGVRRTAREQLDKAVAEIDDSDLGFHETIHQVRKRCKKLRGLVRLVRPCMEDVYKEENAWYRDSARKLSGFRDAQAFLESFDDLVDHFAGTIEQEALAPIRQALVKHRDSRVKEAPDFDARIGEFRERMGRGRMRIDSWPLEREGFDLLQAGLEKTYGRGRKAMRNAYREWTPEAFHEWRKRVKYHWYHARLLRKCWPGPLARYAKELKQLSDYLGDDHDLAVLLQTLRATPDRFGPDKALQALFGLVERRQKELRHKARPLGHRVFVEKKGSHGERLRGYWEAREVEQSLQPQFDKAGGAAPDKLPGD